MLAVTGRGNTIEEARQNAYTGAGKIHWEGLHKREDIAEAINDAYYGDRAQVINTTYEKEHDMKVGILMGSTSDESKMQKAKETLEEFGIESDWRVLSAHRNPEQVVELVSTARENGYVAFICGAGMAAHLALSLIHI